MIGTSVKKELITETTTIIDPDKNLLWIYFRGQENEPNFVEVDFRDFTKINFEIFTNISPRENLFPEGI